MSPCHHVIMSSCHHVIMSSCHHVIMSSCHHVIMSSCHHVIMSSCHHDLRVLDMRCGIFRCRNYRVAIYFIIFWDGSINVIFKVTDFCFPLFILNHKSSREGMGQGNGAGRGAPKTRAPAF